MKEKIRRKIILEDGREFYGYAFGSLQDRVCEIVFNTSMAGYQEILSDPSYTDQAVVMTYPMIGNYGMAEDDYETDVPTIGALVVREYNDVPSNFRADKTLAEVMKQYGISGISGADPSGLSCCLLYFSAIRFSLCSFRSSSYTSCRFRTDTAHFFLS